ncbi:hypothetical protein [Carnobacterium inhibens]|uniref:hypothetical protein n=1 Tax=Carnobacterium inhibens TaxID=147709 RepID=UPI000550506B|nr:hypothetical protein [Carnobacterium inhibens]
MDLKKTWNILMTTSPVVVTLLSAYFTYVIPLNTSFIPDDKAYGISLTFYSGIFAVIFKCIDSLITWFEKQASIINIQFSVNKSDYQEQKIVYCYFKEDTARIFSKIILTGTPRKFLKSKLKLVLPIQVTAQYIPEYAQYYEISENKRSILIDLEKIFNNEKKERMADSIELGFSVIKNDTKVDSYVETTLTSKRKNLKLEQNKLLFTK